MTLSSSWPGTAVPASALETLVLPGRVPGYEPAMLDELTAAGEVAWSGAGALPGNDGWIVLAPAGTAPLLFPAAAEITMTPLHEAVLAASRWRRRAVLPRAGRSRHGAGQAAGPDAHPAAGAHPAGGAGSAGGADPADGAGALAGGAGRSAAPLPGRGRTAPDAPGTRRSRPRSGTWSGPGG